MSYSAFKATESVSETLGAAEYNRQRLRPDPSDRYYIHLSDVRLFLSTYEGGSYDTVLDYGCGGSPYRELFKAVRYLRADYVDCGNLDCIIGADAKLAIPDLSCDMVLSTQVLEHVALPQSYLKEAWRVLKPGGKLILTTHGIWEEHGCPYDFRRWTADGLRQELETAGFQVNKVSKLTTGSRAILCLFAENLGSLHACKFSLLGWAFSLLKRSAFGNPASRHRWMDRNFADARMQDANVPHHGLYLALGAEAVKPSAKAVS